MTQHSPTYEVFVDASGLDLAIDSPYHTTDVQYYDSGIWIDREEDRVFVPYRRVDAIRELPAGERRPTDGHADESEVDDPDVSGEPSTEPPAEPLE